ncbi:hypothetical protein GUJ93_ZPchr0004g38557 [Zizania palustris]|uniref:Uncharacterized protein n=1 Tax=Zizania palustris TaxID=103762 RepID=A0A8J5SYD3_ZIZPA|nr:hypothetical protein GUJ93_ZPchr0004g38557 [Zizania palustris]
MAPSWRTCPFSLVLTPLTPPPCGSPTHTSGLHHVALCMADYAPGADGHHQAKVVVDCPIHMSSSANVASSTRATSTFHTAARVALHAVAHRHPPTTR